MNYKINYKKAIKISIYDAVYLISYSCFLIMAILNTSLYSKYTYRFTGIIYILCIGILAIRELMLSKATIKKATMILIGALVTFLSIIFARGALFAMAIIFVVTAGTTDIKKILNVALIITICTCMFVLFSSRAGIVEDYIYTLDFRTRHSLGFRYVLCLPTYMFNITAIMLYLKKEKIGISTVIILLVLNSVIHYYTRSRLTYYTTIFILIYAFILKLHSRFQKSVFFQMDKLWALLIPIYIVLCIISIVITAFYNPGVQWQRTLNSLLGGRLGIGQRSFIIYGVSLMGNSDIEWIGQGLNIYGEKVSGTITYVDNMYFSILQQYGIIVLVIVMAFLTIMMYKCYKLGDKLLFVILIVLALHGLIDSLIQQLPFNSFIHFIYYLFILKPQD